MKCKKMRMRVISDINVTPFVDIMLVLLVVFMISAPMFMSSTDVDVPGPFSKSNLSSDNRSALLLTVTKSGDVYLQNKLVNISDLRHEISIYLEKDKNLKVFLKGDKNVDYNVIVKTLLATKGTGIKNVSLVVDTES